MFLSVFLLLLKASAHIKVIILMLFLPRIQVRKFLSCARMVSMHLAPFLDVSALPSPFLQPLPQLFTILIIHCKYITKKKNVYRVSFNFNLPESCHLKAWEGKKERNIYISWGKNERAHFKTGISKLIWNFSCCV